MRSHLLKALFAAVAAVGVSASASAATITQGSSFGAYFNTPPTGNLTFDYNLITTNNAAVSPQIDFAFYTLNGVAHLLDTQNSATVNTTNLYNSAAFQTASPGSGSPSFYQTFTIPSASLLTGINSIGFGVVAVNGGTNTTSLVIDNVRVGGTIIATTDSTGTAASANDGSFETGGGNFTQLTVDGNAVNSLDPLENGVSASDGTEFVIVSTARSGVTGSISDPDPNFANVKAGAITSDNSLQGIADSLDPSAVPLPSGLLVAPLGLAVAGLYVARSRRTVA